MPIGEHVEEEANGKCTELPGPVEAVVGQESHHSVESNGRIGVERMETDAHAVWVENGRRQEMVEVDDHRGQHDEAGCLASAAREKKAEKERSQEVEAVMNKKPSHSVGKYTIEEYQESASLSTRWTVKNRAVRLKNRHRPQAVESEAKKKATE